MTRPICPCTYRTRSLPPVVDDGVLVAIAFDLVSGRNLKRECFVVLERRSAIEPDAGNAHNGELDRHHIPFLPRRKVSRCAVRRANSGIGKRLGIEACRVLYVTVASKTNRVLCLLCHSTSPWCDAGCIVHALAVRTTWVSRQLRRSVESRRGGERLPGDFRLSRKNSHVSS